MQILYHIARLALAGLLFMASAAQLGFAPAPEQSMFTNEGWAFLQALLNTGYIMPIVGSVCAVSGATMLFNRYVALGSIILVPISLNILLFHVFLDAVPVSTNATPAYILFVLNIFILLASRSRFDGVFLK